MENPYDVLGLPYTATIEEIRKKYKQLAREHHPDKWTGASREEYYYHEEEFKKITVAYHILIEGDTSNCTPGTNGTRYTGFGSDTTPKTKEEWENIWKRMEDILQKRNILGHLSKLFQTTLEKMATTKNTRHTPGSGSSSDSEDIPTSKGYVHTFTIPVSLEEITYGKKKKVRLFLKDDPDPFFVTVPCDQYPTYETGIFRPGKPNIEIRLFIKPLPHTHYVVDEIIDGEYDLFKKIPISLLDYFQGKVYSWTHLDGSNLEVEIPPLCGKGHGEIIERREGLGLMGKGALYIALEWSIPTQNEWVHMRPDDQENFLKYLDKLCGHSRAQKEKGI